MSASGSQLSRVSLHPHFFLVTPPPDCPGVHRGGLVRLGKTTFPDLFVPLTPLLTYSMSSPQDPEPLLNEFEVRLVLLSKTSFLLGNDAILISVHSVYNATSNVLLEVLCT